MVTHKEFSAGVIVTGIIITVVASACYVILPKFFSSKINLMMGANLFNATVVSDEEGRSIGLGGASSLAKDDAYIFAFPSEDKWDIGSPRETVDVYWLSESKKIVYSAKNISSSNSEKLDVSVKSKYIVILSSASGGRFGIDENSTVSFDFDTGKIE